jgi:glycosyltransferase involved in cell wall biosynthesis
MTAKVEPGNAALTPRDKQEPGTRITACVITYNEVDRIARCLKSLDFCDEIVVVDSHSTDETQAIAMRSGARVIARDWSGYRSQKQFAVDAASHDWVLSLDADEVVSPRLRAEILALRGKGLGDVAGYSMPRCTEYFGRMIRRGNSYPDRKLRLFDRRRARWSGREIHEKVKADGPVLRLRGELEHYAYRNLADFLGRRDRYATLMACAMHAEGRRAHAHELWLRPISRFLRGYVLRLGFLDGWRGWVIAWAGADYVYRKYLRLWLLNRGIAIAEQDKAAPASLLPEVDAAER